jgi:hypothetical protein
VKRRGFRAEVVEREGKPTDSPLHFCCVEWLVEEIKQIGNSRGDEKNRPRT